MYQPRSKAVRVLAESLLSIAALLMLTLAVQRLGIRAEPAALLYLSLVLLVSVRGSVVPALIVAVGGTVAWDFVFSSTRGPQREFGDAVTLVAFSATAIIVTRLVSALRKSESRWRNVFDNNPTMYFMVDPSGTVLSVNPAGAEQLGYTESELIGDSVLKVFLDDDKAAATDHVARCLGRLGKSFSWELRKVRKNGSMLWVRETARAVQLGDAAPVVLIACEDITERRAAHDKLRENEARLRSQASLLDLTHDAIFVRDMNSVVVYWNRGAEQLYGWTSEEAIGRVTHELLRTEFPEPLADIMATVQRTGRWDGELIHTKRDGTRVVVASRWSLQRDEHGNPIGALETNNDITEHKRAEWELRRSQAYLAEAQRLSHTGSFGWNPSTGTINWSEETYRIFDCDPSTEPTIELILARTHPDDKPAVETALQRLLQEANDFEIEYRIVSHDGSIKHLHVVGHAVQGTSGLAEYVGAVMDVTQQKRSEEALRTAQAELARANTLTIMGQLASSLAHEMRQPLAAIAMNGSATLRWLDRESPDVAEARESASRIVREAMRADEVIRGLWSLVGRAEPHHHPFEINDAIREVLELTRGELRRNRVSVQLDLDPTVVPAIGDRVQLQQVVLNLIMNAVEAVSANNERPKILVIRTSGAEAGDIAVSVEDNGRGLDANIAQRVFDPFFTTKPDGLGMGLSICRSIIDAHGRRLSVKPAAPHGTCFSFTIPTSLSVSPAIATHAAEQISV